MTESSVRVRVLNGTGNPGEASTTSKALRAVGFAIAGTGDANELGATRTEIRYPVGTDAEADLVARWLVNGAELVPDPDVDDVTLVTGEDFAGLRETPTPSTSTVSSTTLPRTTTTTTEVGRSTTTVLGTIPTEVPADASCG